MARKFIPRWKKWYTWAIGLGSLLLLLFIVPAWNGFIGNRFDAYILSILQQWFVDDKVTSFGYEVLNLILWFCIFVTGLISLININRKLNSTVITLQNIQEENRILKEASDIIQKRLDVYSQLWYKSSQIENFIRSFPFFLVQPQNQREASLKKVLRIYFQGISDHPILADSHLSISLLKPDGANEYLYCFQTHSLPEESKRKFYIGTNINATRRRKNNSNKIRGKAGAVYIRESPEIVTFYENKDGKWVTDDREFVDLHPNQKITRYKSIYLIPIISEHNNYREKLGLLIIDSMKVDTFNDLEACKLIESTVVPIEVALLLLKHSGKITAPPSSP